MTSTARDPFNPATLLAAQKLALDALLAEVVRSFTASGIQPLLLKGPVFAQWLYDNPSERSYNDIDLLVAPDQFELARRSLTGLGFEPVDRAWATKPAYEEVWQRRDGKSAWVELHRTLFLVPAAPSLVWRRLTEGATTIEVADVRVNVPGEPGCALIVALHAAFHGSTWARPRVDLERALARVDVGVWRSAAALAQDLGAGSTFAVGLCQAPAGRDLTEALGLSVKGAPRAVRLRTSAPATAVQIEWFIEQLLASPGVRARLHFLAREIVPTREWMLECEPIAQRGRAWLVWAYLARLLRLAKLLRAGLGAWVRAALARPSRRIKSSQ